MICRAQQIVCLALVLLVVLGCEPKPLPEQGSVGAELYRQRCSGSCHVLYYPPVMTADMWTTMVERMESEMFRSGMPLTAAEKEEILAYLRRNSGGR